MKIETNFDDIKLMQRRFELITVARYRDKGRIRKAMQVQDELRERTKGVTWNSTEELRKWRDSRYGPSSA